jgi:uncharacterized protein YceH (UPF0502 family)
MSDQDKRVNEEEDLKGRVARLEAEIAELRERLKSLEEYSKEW